jgi:pimeloyl-ACP methyl ester carboxylesterase
MEGRRLISHARLRAPRIRSAVAGMVCGTLCALLQGCGEDGAPAASSAASDAAAASDTGSASMETGASDSAEPGIERIEIRVGELTFDARAAGPEDGQLVLLLHGFPQTSFQYRQQLSALGAAGYRAVAPDQRGYSPGARPSAVSEYGILKLAQDVLALADALGRDQFHLVGHDWGGGIAWTVARFYPQRVRSLFMLSTPHPDAMNAELSKPDSCQTKASAYFDAFVGDGALSYLRSMGTDSQLGFQCVDSDALGEYLTIIGDDAALTAALNWYRANVKNRKFDAPAIGAVAVPTHYLWGADDTAFCREAAEHTADFVSASYTFEVVPGVGHWITDCASDRVSERLLAHLAKNAPER